MTTDNYKKHTSKNPLQRFLIEKFFNALVYEVRSRNPIRILDVGCGEGFTLERLRKEGIGQVLEGIDAQKSVVELGKITHPKLTLREESIYALPYEDNSFDMVLCTEVLEHLEHPENALKELYRVCGRYCVITVPNEPFFQTANFLRGKNLSRFGNDIEHIQHWSTRGITKFVGKLFSIQKVKAPFPWSLIVAKK
jgi:ubiquinone/menaquinone biosynthesis C-methylase UbiE